MSLSVLNKLFAKGPFLGYHYPSISTLIDENTSKYEAYVSPNNTIDIEIDHTLPEAIK